MHMIKSLYTEYTNRNGPLKKTFSNLRYSQFGIHREDDLNTN